MKTRKGKGQRPSEYDLASIPISKHLAEQGIEMWYWHVFPGAFDCPKEPLTLAFWEAQGSELLHGIVLPGVLKEDGGDLIVLLTQRVNGDHNDIQGTTVPPNVMQEFYFRLLKLPFPHAGLLTMAPSPLRKALITKLERIFREHVVPHEWRG